MLKQKKYIGPYNYSKYNFVIDNSIDLKDSWIQYAENNIDRASNQIKLNNILKNIDIALKIELSIFEYSLIYCLNNKYDKTYVIPIYNDKFHFIMSNLDETNPNVKNNYFKPNVLNGTINPAYVAFLSPMQVHPEKWDDLIKKKKYTEYRENNVAYSDMYKCYKCGESKCKITQAQTRSADEAMTTFVVCLICHNTFKFS